jgi:hypothetical protein
MIPQKNIAKKMSAHQKLCQPRNTIGVLGIPMNFNRNEHSNYAMQIN